MIGIWHRWQQRRAIRALMATTLKARCSELAANVTANKALLQRLQYHRANQAAPKPLTKAQKAKLKRDRERGEAYLAKANALGVYNDGDDYD